MNPRFLLMALVGMCAPILAQDQKAPTFHAAINCVEFSVRVVDARGQFVRDLQRSDFRVFEDGRPQTIARFQLVDLPIPNAKAVTGPSRGGAEPLSTEDLQQLDGRLYIFPLDDYHLPSEHSSGARTIVGSFIRERVGPNDAAMFVFSETDNLGQCSSERTNP
jgi:VWFA-related protein